MRLSRVLLAGTAVAAAGIATSAFTAGNTVEESVAGYAQADVSGAQARHINYVLDDTDKSVLNGVNFEIVENLDGAVAEGLQAWLTLNNEGSQVSTYECDIAAFTTDQAPDPEYTPITCDIDPGVELESFDGIGLTVAE